MNEMNDELKDYFQSAAYEKAKAIASRKEEVLEAFVAKYGYQPDEMIIYEQPSSGKFWVEKKSKWLNVKDKLPDHNQFILGIGKGDIPMVLRFDLHQWKNEVFDYVFMRPDLKGQITDVTHWMPLPEPPNLTER